MNLDGPTCYSALRSRDARFDGRFFTAVRTTGVYCRPVCPAPTPKRENIEFFACAAAAEQAGFRPCLRCRPESAPGTPAWLGTSATVSRALKLIDGGALDEGGVDQLAERLGIGDRHLRRLFLRHLGVTPIAVARTKRVQLAKRLLDETALAVTEIAFASGFSSVRRFNAAIRDVYRRNPSELRRAANRPRRSAADGATDGTAEIKLRLGYRPPYDWPQIAAFLEIRAVPGVERVTGGRYERTIRAGEAIGTISVRPAEGRHALDATVRVSTTTALSAITARLVRLFDLGADPEPIGAELGRDPALRELVRRRPGLRVPGAWDPFEIAVRAVLGQQVSVAGARTLAARLVERYGTALDHPSDGLTHLFPRAADLAEADLTTLGMPSACGRALTGLATAVATGRVRLDAALGLDETVAELTALPGIGEWTAQYIAMRALGEPDAMPHGDLGLLRALAENGDKITAMELQRRAESWRPWRAYATMHLWLGEEPIDRESET